MIWSLIGHCPFELWFVAFDQHAHAHRKLVTLTVENVGVLNQCCGCFWLLGVARTNACDSQER
jgi:hypothetical protein